MSCVWKQKETFECLQLKECKTEKYTYLVAAISLTIDYEVRYDEKQTVVMMHPVKSSSSAIFTYFNYILLMQKIYIKTLI